MILNFIDKQQATCLGNYMEMNSYSAKDNKCCTVLVCIVINIFIPINIFEDFSVMIFRSMSAAIQLQQKNQTPTMSRNIICILNRLPKPTPGILFLAPYMVISLVVSYSINAKISACKTITCLRNTNENNPSKTKKWFMQLNNW